MILSPILAVPENSEVSILDHFTEKGGNETKKSSPGGRTGAKKNGISMFVFPKNVTNSPQLLPQAAPVAYFFSGRFHTLFQ